MPIVDMQELLTKAREGKFAIGSFNVFNIEMVQGIVAAAEQHRVPVILALSESHIKFSDFDLITFIMKDQAKKSSCPISLQLDHSKTFKTIKMALDAGFNSVMFDGYDLPFNEKIKQTAEIVEMAHKNNALVEAPLGRISTVGKNNEIKYSHDDITDPGLIEEFVTKTGIDILAVSVGTTHGRNPGESILDYSRLKNICEKTDAFISLHGGSGVKDKAYREAINIGVHKISIFTRVSNAAVNSIIETLKTTRMRLPELLVEARKGVTREAGYLMDIFKNDR
ncbi:class II fructose-bisphosphate aldolase [Thermoanaerobacteraceae bacterium SP2]|nr:class II fructose-bisphosphate aldolase [Thermoanaerobacteraceae bacterium SP2]